MRRLFFFNFRAEVSCAILYTYDHRHRVSAPPPLHQSTAAKLARSTGRSRAFLAAEAIEEYLDINEWQVAGIVGAIASLDRGKGIPHRRVQEWVASWETRKERPVPKAA